MREMNEKKNSHHHVRPPGIHFHTLPVQFYSPRESCPWNVSAPTVINRIRWIESIPTINLTFRCKIQIFENFNWTPKQLNFKIRHTSKEYSREIAFNVRSVSEEDCDDEEEAFTFGLGLIGSKFELWSNRRNLIKRIGVSNLSVADRVRYVS